MKQPFNTCFNGSIYRLIKNTTSMLLFFFLFGSIQAKTDLTAKSIKHVITFSGVNANYNKDHHKIRSIHCSLEIVETGQTLSPILTIVVLPNPFTDHVNIHVEQNYEQNLKLEVFNQLGQPIPIDFSLDAIISTMGASLWEALAYLRRFIFRNQF